MVKTLKTQGLNRNVYILSIVIVCVVIGITFSGAEGVYPSIDNRVVVSYHFDNNAALGESQILVVDSSLRGVNATVNGSINNVTGAYLQQYLGVNGFNFDGLNDSIYTKVNSPLTSSNFTICSWVNPTTNGGGGGLGRLMSYNETAGIIIAMNSGGLRITLAGGNYNTVTNLLGSWNHVCFTKSDTMVIGYKNALNVSNFTYSGGALSYGSIPIYIGNNVAGSRPFNGTIDDFLILNYTASAENITKIYNDYLRTNNCVNLSLNSNLRVFSNSNGSINTLNVCTGNYNMNSSSTNSPAINISGPNINLNLNNSMIFNGPLANGMGILALDTDNITIQNGVVSSYSQNLRVHDMKNITLLNITFYNGTDDSVELNDVDNGYIADVKFVTWVVADSMLEMLNVNNITLTNFNFTQYNTSTYYRHVQLLNYSASTIRDGSFYWANECIDSPGGATNTISFDNVLFKNFSCRFAMRGLELAFGGAGPVSNFNMTNLEIKNRNPTVDSNDVTEGIKLYNLQEGSSVIIQGSRISNYSESIRNDNVSSLAIRGNDFGNTPGNHDTYDNNIHFIAYRYQPSTYLDISNNNFSNIANCGVALQGVNYVNVTNNYFNTNITESMALRINNLYEPISAICITQRNKGWIGIGSDALNEVGNWTSYNVRIANNTINESIPVQLVTEGIVNLTHDLSNNWNVSFRAPSSLSGRLNYYIQNSWNNVSTVQNRSDAQSPGTVEFGQFLGQGFRSSSAMYVRYTIYTSHVNFTNINTSTSQQIEFYELNDALIYNKNLSICGSSNVGSNDGGVNCTFAPLHHLVRLNNHNLTEGQPRIHNPLWFSYSTDTEKRIASNLSNIINDSIIINIGNNTCSSADTFTYATHSGVTTEWTGADAVAVCNNLTTIGQVLSIEPATASNTLLLEWVTGPGTPAGGGGGGGGSTPNPTPVVNNSQPIIPNNQSGSVNETIQPKPGSSNIFKVTDKKVWIIGIIVMGVLLLGMIIAFILNSADRNP